MIESRYILQNDPTVDAVGVHDLPVKSKWSRPYEYEFAMRWVQPGLRMVDAASGGGTHPFCHYLADVAPGLAAAVDLAPWLTGKVPAGLEYHQQSMTNMPFDSGSVDVVFSVSVIEHCKSRVVNRFFAEAARVLKPGGWFIITQNVPPRPPSIAGNQLRRMGFCYEQLTESDDVPDGAIAADNPRRWCYRWACQLGRSK